MRKLTQTNRTGLTLIEMMIALAAACIVVLTTATILVFGQKSWNRTLQQASLQKDAAQAMLEMRLLIRSASDVRIGGNGREMTIDPNTEWIRFRFIPEQRDLVYQRKARSEQMLLDGIVEGVTFNVDPNTHRTVTVDLQLRSGSSDIRLLSTTMMRNYAAGL
jgi:prepilin-type N-terminal cleavage/methylation domain-containing protein